MNNLFKIATLTSFLFVSHAGAADDSYSALYVGAELGTSTYQQAGKRDRNPVGGMKIGYQLTSNFGLELIANSLSLHLDGPFASAAYYPDNHIALAALGQVELTYGISVFGRIGIGRTRLHSALVVNPDRSEREASIGAGLSYQVSPKVQLSLEARRLQSAGVTLVVAGIRYQF